PPPKRRLSLPGGRLPSTYSWRWWNEHARPAPARTRPIASSASGQRSSPAMAASTPGATSRTPPTGSLSAPSAVRSGKPYPKGTPTWWRWRSIRRPIPSRPRAGPAVRWRTNSAPAWPSSAAPKAEHETTPSPSCCPAPSVRQIWESRSPLRRPSSLHRQSECLALDLAEELGELLELIAHRGPQDVEDLGGLLPVASRISDSRVRHCSPTLISSSLSHGSHP